MNRNLSAKRGSTARTLAWFRMADLPLLLFVARPGRVRPAGDVGETVQALSALAGRLEAIAAGHTRPKAAGVVGLHYKRGQE